MILLNKKRYPASRRNNSPWNKVLPLLDYYIVKLKQRTAYQDWHIDKIAGVTNHIPFRSAIGLRDKKRQTIRK